MTAELVNALCKGAHFGAALCREIVIQGFELAFECAEARFKRL